MSRKRIVIFGATSAIAQESARIYAERSSEFFLLGRNSEKLEIVADDLKVRGATSVETKQLDVCMVSEHEKVIADIFQKLGSVDILLIAYGSLSDQKRAEKETDYALAELKTNFLSVCSLVSRFANRFEEEQQGTIAVISSVAGDRGRQSNYVYGSAKAALSVFLQGLRNRLAKSGVQVLTIKPGFVDTPMTAHLKQGLLYVKPKVVGEGIVKAIEKGKDVVYLPWFWRYIMLIIRLIPEGIFKKMKL